MAFRLPAPGTWMWSRLHQESKESSSTVNLSMRMEFIETELVRWSLTMDKLPPREMSVSFSLPAGPSPYDPPPSMTELLQNPVEKVL